MEERFNSLEEACKYYKLTQEEHDRIGRNINEIMMCGKQPQENPIAVIDIAPPGSGKTGLNGYALKQFSNGNLIIVNNDELKPFHPKADEVANKYPEYYIKVTNEESKRWTDNLVDKAIEEISKADLLIVAGTSLTVYPASSFVRYFKGKYLVIINNDETNYDGMADLVIHKRIGDVFKQLKI